MDEIINDIVKSMDKTEIDLNTSLNKFNEKDIVDDVIYIAPMTRS